MSTQPVFALVGHCGPDNAMLKLAVQRAVPGASVAVVADDDALKDYSGPNSILLINRVLDGDFADESGIELMRLALAGPSPPIAILISNLPEAQEEARSVGAAPGFGKSQLYDAATAEILRNAVRVAGAHSNGLMR